MANSSPYHAPFAQVWNTGAEGSPLRSGEERGKRGDQDGVYS